MADLRVDDGVLADCELRLSRLHREFRCLDTQRDHLRAQWGCSGLAAAMDDFFDNWSHYRAQLLAGIETVGRQVATTRVVFRRTDEELARGVGAAGGSRGAGGAGGPRAGRP